MTPSSRDRALLVVLVAVLLVSGAWFFWLTPTAAALQSSMTQASGLGQEVTMLKQRREFLAAVARELSANPEAERLLSLAAPSESAVANLLASLDAMALESGVRLTNVQPQPAGLSPQELALTVGVSGTFGGIQSFVRALDAHIRPLAIHTLTLTGGASTAGSTLVNAALTIGALQVAPASSAAPPTAPGGAQ